MNNLVNRESWGRHSFPHIQSAIKILKNEAKGIANMNSFHWKIVMKYFYHFFLIYATFHSWKSAREFRSKVEPWSVVFTFSYVIYKSSLSYIYTSPKQKESSRNLYLCTWHMHLGGDPSSCVFYPERCQYLFGGFRGGLESWDEVVS